MANMGLLSLPLMLQSAGYLTGSLTIVEMVAWGLWSASLAWEHTADMQKLNFAKYDSILIGLTNSYTIIRESKKSGRKGGVCNIGLWQYCRHPNYFGEWMVWNSLILITLPSHLSSLSSGLDFVVLAGLLSISYIM